MSAQDVQVRFRELLAEKSLGWNSSDCVPSHFLFTLNNGHIYAQRDPESVMEIIRIGYNLHPDKISGEWSHLLDMVAVRSELNDGHVVWYRSYYRDDTDGPDFWVSLRDWLKEHEQDPELIYSQPPTNI